MAVKVKICGIMRAEDADAASGAMPDFAGFVFAPMSRRAVTLGQALLFRKRLAPGIVPVGVFAQNPLGQILEAFQSGAIEMAQLHGGEGEGEIGFLVGKGIPVVQAIRQGRGDRPSQIADYHLFDSWEAGSGLPFDWALFQPEGKPAFLAGGISMENLPAALSLSPFAVDISSGAETGGAKDPEKMREIVRCARERGN
jgi:phosphoribosylanthranilate isomerase